MKRLACCLLFFAATAPAATIAHDYNLKSSLTDLVGSDNLTGDGGSISASGYSFAANQGLNVSSALTNTGDYSLLMDFSFTDQSGYKKIVDFLDRSSDNGLYDLDTDLNFYPVVTGPSAFSANTPARVVLTRDSGTNVVAGYVNGALQFTFTDTTPIAVFSAPNGLIRFFEDDFYTGQREASAGLATRISIYNGALSSASVLALGGPSDPASSSATPEPASFLFMISGLAGLACVAARRSRA